jgi:hypothetical protein
MKYRIGKSDGRGLSEEESQTEARTRHDARSSREQESQRMSARPGPLFHRALLMAHRGRFEDATVALSLARESGHCTDGESLDLQARMYAQQGLYLHAESCWRKAQHLGGGKPEYAAALSRLHASHNRPLRLMVIACGLLIIGGLGVLTWQVTAVLPARHRQLTEAIAHLSTSHAQTTAESTTKLQDLRASLAAADKNYRLQLDDVSTRLWTELSSVRVQLDAVRVALDSSINELGSHKVAVAAEVESARRDAAESAVKLSETIAALRVSSHWQHTADAVVLGKLSRNIAAHASTLEKLSSAIAASGEHSCGLLSEVASIRSCLDQVSIQSATAFYAIRRELAELRKRLGSEANEGLKANNAEFVRP